MFHEIYEIPTDVYFSPTEIDTQISSNTYNIDSELEPNILNIQADVICTTYEINSDFKEVIRIQEIAALNKVDNRSIDLNFNSEVEIKNYTSAKQGQMPTYDNTQGIRWVDPLNSHELNVKVEQAKLYKDESATNALITSNKAAEVSMQVEHINSAVEHIDNKFWFGTIVEYNKLLVIDPNKIYVITT